MGDGFTSPPPQGRHAVDFFARKIRRLRPGSNARSWVPEASRLTTRPPKPLIYIYISGKAIRSNDSSVRAVFLQPDVAVTDRRTDKNGFIIVGFLVRTDSVDQRHKTSSRARTATTSSVRQVSVLFGRGPAENQRKFCTEFNCNRLRRKP